MEAHARSVYISEVLNYLLNPLQSFIEDSQSPPRCRQRLSAEARDPKPSEAMLCKAISLTAAGPNFHVRGPLARRKCNEGRLLERTCRQGSRGERTECLPQEPLLDGLFRHIGFRHIKACKRPCTARHTHLNACRFCERVCKVLMSIQRSHWPDVWLSFVDTDTLDGLCPGHDWLILALPEDPRKLRAGPLPSDS